MPSYLLALALLSEMALWEPPRNMPPSLLLALLLVMVLLFPQTEMPSVLKLTLFAETVL